MIEDKSTVTMALDQFHEMEREIESLRKRLGEAEKALDGLPEEHESLHRRLELAEAVCEAANRVFGENPIHHDAYAIRETLQAWRASKEMG